MALLQLQQQQQVGSYEASDAAQLAELQGVPLSSLGSLSNEALISLQSLVRPRLNPGSEPFSNQQDGSCLAPAMCECHA